MLNYAGRHVRWGWGWWVSSKRHSLQAVGLSQMSPTAVQIVSKPPSLNNGGPIYLFFDKPTMRTRWMAGGAPHKSEWCRDKSSSDNHTKSLDLWYLPYIQTLIHTTHNFKWSRYTLTILNISQLQTFIYLLKTAHPRTTKQLTRTYNTTYSTSQTYHTQSSPEMWSHTPLSGTHTLMTTKDN